MNETPATTTASTATTTTTTLRKGYTPPTGYHKLLEISGNVGIGRLLRRQADNVLYAHFIFWKKEGQEKAGNLFVRADRIDTAKLKVGTYKDGGPNYAEAISKCVKRAKGGGVPLIPLPPKADSPATTAAAPAVAASAPVAGVAPVAQ